MARGCSLLKTGVSSNGPSNPIQKVSEKHASQRRPEADHRLSYNQTGRILERSKHTVPAKVTRPTWQNSGGVLGPFQKGACMRAIRAGAWGRHARALKAGARIRMSSPRSMWRLRPLARVLEEEARVCARAPAAVVPRPLCSGQSGSVHARMYVCKHVARQAMKSPGWMGWLKGCMCSWQNCRDCT